MPYAKTISAERRRGRAQIERNNPVRNVLRYKGFVGSLFFSPSDDCFHGRIEGIDDLVSFEGRSVDELKERFREAVDDYCEFCKAAGKKPEKSYTGSFNIRVSPDLHKKAVHKSTCEGISLNQLVAARRRILMPT